MKNPLVILFFVTICVGLASCYEYKDYSSEHSDEDSDEDFHSGEVNHDKEHHYPSHEGHKHKAQDKDKGSPQWHYTKPTYDEAKPVYEKEEDSKLQENIKQVFGISSGSGWERNKDSGLQWNPSEQPDPRYGASLSGGSGGRVIPQEGASLFSQQGSIGGLYTNILSSLGPEYRIKRQRNRRQSPDASVIEIDGANVKFNEDQGSTAGVVAPPVIEESGITLNGREEEPIRMTSEQPLSQPNDNTGLFIDQQAKEDGSGLRVNQGAPLFPSSELPPSGENQNTGFGGISLINDDSISQLTPKLEKEVAPLKLDSADEGIKFNQGIKSEYENGYNEGFKDGYHKGAKEGFDHGAKYSCHSNVDEKGDGAYKFEHKKEILEVNHEEKKPVIQEEVVESGVGELTLQNPGVIVEVESPAVVPIAQEEIKEEGHGKLTIVHKDEEVHTNTPKEKHDCNKHVKEDGIGKYKTEHEEKIVQITEAAVTPSYEEVVKEIAGGDLTIVQEDTVAHVENPTVTPIVQEEKKEVIKTNKKPEHKYWHHDHDHKECDDGQYHDFYHYGHKGSHQGSKHDDYAHWPHYNGQYHGSKHDGQYHGYYNHGHHNDHHKDTNNPHNQGSDYYHSSPGFPTHHDYPNHHGFPDGSEEWDSSEEDSDSEESNAGHHVPKRSVEKPMPYDLKEAPELFRKYIEDYNKKYKDETDHQKHYMNFVKNLEDINRLNAEGGTATFEINMFADVGDDELHSTSGGSID